MKLRDYNEWLNKQQWDGYTLDRILVNARPENSGVFDWYNSYMALRSLFILCCGFNGEGGEVTEHFKKFLRDGNIDKHAVGLELGDRLAYLTWLAATCEFSLEDIAEMNRQKLIARHPERQKEST